MNHSRAAELDPAGVLADATPGAFALEATEIKLRARLGEGKVRRAKTRDRVGAKHAAQKLRHCSLQMRHRDAAIHAESLDLVEHRIVRRVGRVATKNTSGRDHANRHAATLHRMNLHGGCLRTKREAV